MGGTLQFLRFAFVSLRAILPLPLWLVLYTIPDARPCRRWSYGRALLMRTFHTLFSNGLVQGHLDILIPSPPSGCEELLRPENVGRPSKHKDGLIAIPPAPADKVGKELSDIAIRNGVTLEDVPVLGYWHGTRSPDGEVGCRAADNERVILNLHGGGFIMDTGAAGSMGGAWIHRVREASPAVHRTFIPEYRLSAVRRPSQGPRNPFPAALLDGLAGYIYLLSLGFEAENIILSGESVGGNLAVNLAHHLPTVGLPMPGRVLVLSPAADCGLTHSGPGSSAEVNASLDYGLPFFVSQIMLDAVRGDAFTREDAWTSMWLSPGGRNVAATHAAGWFAPLKETQTMIIAGGAECALDGIRTLKQRILMDLGKEDRDRLVYLEEPDAPHDYPSLGIWDPEGARAIERAVEFLED